MHITASTYVAYAGSRGILAAIDGKKENNVGMQEAGLET